MFYKWHHVFGPIRAGTLHLVYFAVRRKAIAPRDVALARMRLCNRCDHIDSKSRRCRLCSCYVDLKTRYAHQGCPARRWPRLPLFSRWEHEPLSDPTSQRGPEGSGPVRPRDAVPTGGSRKLGTPASGSLVGFAEDS
ncbi:MAG: hypothetical protein HY812_13400 [Planctomycetes bacterium]|nr:hypothetical protein [Planctomycetota bacterium]